MATKKTALRSAMLTAVGAMLVSLAACTGAGLNVPAGEAYLTIQNPNDPTKGTFDYTNLFLDGHALSIDKIGAGGTFQVPYLVTVGTHTLDLTFVEQPTGGTVTMTPKNGLIITIPPSASQYTYTGGPVYTAP